MKAITNAAPSTVGAAIKELRQALGGITQEGFARQLQVTVRTVARWESPDAILTARTLSQLRNIALEARAYKTAATFERKIRQYLDWENNGRGESR